MSIRVILRNGEEVKVNDHVYCSPSWDARDGTPYSVARIMQFLPPEDAPRENGTKFLYTRVRLAWYYRPGDVSDRPVSDSRLLLAAIYSEVCDINQLRAKCHVVHRDQISDLAGWKKRPDRFYFNRLFDPYIKKEFEVIPSRDVRNLPDDIREVLTSRYEYIVAEKEVIPDLTDAIRRCGSCTEWCPSPQTVQCDRCKVYFHLKCVQPPLPAKPTRGYGWTCAPCARQHEEEVDNHQIRHPTPVASTTRIKSNAPAARGRGRPRKDKTLAEKEENLPIKHFNMWPFRYFGQYTDAKDTLDPEDLIFPRTASRIGPKYQASVPPHPDPCNLPPDVEERGYDATVEVLGILNTFTDSELTEAEEAIQKLSKGDKNLRSKVDWITEVVKRISEAEPSGSTIKIPLMRQEKWKKHETPYTDKEWSREEEAAFEDAIMHHGAELRAVRDEVSSRTMPEVVRYYGLWKCEKLGEENRRKASSRSRSVSLHRYPTLQEEDEFQRLSGSDDDSSIIAQPSKTPSCAACKTQDSPTWWKAPKGLRTNILCDICGQNWRKYAELNVRVTVRDETASNTTKSREKREGTPLTNPSAKRARTSTSVQSTPPPPATLPQNRCCACQKTGPPSKVVKCKQCGFRAHAGIIGAAVDPSPGESWSCDLCENEEAQEASFNSDCLLCPRSSAEDKRKGGNVWPPADNFLRACKATEGQGWVHVLCAVFMPELVFADSNRLRLVEGISMITRHRWTTKCCLCGEVEGAVIKCNDCPKEYHASCAWKQGHKFGFEIQPVKSSRRDTTIITTFKGETGCMNAIVSCKDHDHSKRDIYDLCDTNEEGGLTAVQAYCSAYRQAPSNAHGLLRKARRLDQILNIRSNSDNRDHHNHHHHHHHSTPSSSSTRRTHSPSPNPGPGPNSAAALNSASGNRTSTTPEPECTICHTQFSPAFYPCTKEGILAPSTTTNGVNPNSNAVNNTNGVHGDWLEPPSSEPSSSSSTPSSFLSRVQTFPPLAPTSTTGKLDAAQKWLCHRCRFNRHASASIQQQEKEYQAMKRNRDGNKL